MKVRLKTNILLLCLALISIKSYCQKKEIEKDSIKPSPKLTISDVSYSTFGYWEQHSSFTFKYILNPKLTLEIRGFFDTYISGDVFKAPITTRKYISDKLNIFSGVEIEMERGGENFVARKQRSNSNAWTPPQLKSKNGIGYDLTPKFQLQIEHDLHFNKSKVGNYSFPELFSFRGKLKF